MKLTARIETGETRQTLHLRGRQAWALMELLKAGETGITSRQNPAPRISAYVHSLRRKGVSIDTDWEKHGGTYPGEHGVYRLRSAVKIQWMEGRT